MKAILPTLALVAATAFAQQRCDAMYPEVYCNTTEILAFEGYDCKQFHVFISRGSDEPYPGRQGNLTSQICSKLGKDKCSYEDIKYPAKSTAWGKEKWCESAAAGAANGQAQFRGYHDQCPDSKLILMGYSQGGSVAQDILGGGGGQVFECEQASNPALDASIASNGKLPSHITNYANILTIPKSLQQ
jgi:acetylxylan esterase